MVRKDVEFGGGDHEYEHGKVIDKIQRERFM